MGCPLPCVVMAPYAYANTNIGISWCLRLRQRNKELYILCELKNKSHGQHLLVILICRPLVSPCSIFTLPKIGHADPTRSASAVQVATRYDCAAPGWRHPARLAHARTAEKATPWSGATNTASGAVTLN